MSMTPRFADLHTHTTRSDGKDSVRELIDSAAAVEGLCAIALTDHDVLPPKSIDIDGAQTDPVEYAAGKGLLLLPGIEISCDTYVDDVHIVGLFCDFDSEGFLKLEQDMKQSKTEGYKKLCELLTERGMDVSWDFVLKSTGRAEDEIQRKMIFEAIAAKGYTKDWSEAKIMVRDDPGLNFRREKPDPVAAIELIHSAGGCAVLAHPFLIDEEVTRGDGSVYTRAEYIELLLGAGLDGIEVDYPYSKTSYKGSMSDDEIAGKVYKTYGTRVSFISGGSDYHAEYKKGVKNARGIGEGRIARGYLEKMILPHGRGVKLP